MGFYFCPMTCHEIDSGKANRRYSCLKWGNERERANATSGSEWMQSTRSGGVKKKGTWKRIWVAPKSFNIVWKRPLLDGTVGQAGESCGRIGVAKKWPKVLWRVCCVLFVSERGSPPFTYKRQPACPLTNMSNCNVCPRGMKRETKGRRGTDVLVLWTSRERYFHLDGKGTWGQSRDVHCHNWLDYHLFWFVQGV